MNVKKVNLSKFSAKYMLFSIAYFPWIISWMFTSSYYKDLIHPYGVINIWRYVGVAFLIAKIFMDKISNCLILFGKIVIIVVGAIVSSGNGNASFVFYTMILIVAAFDLNIKWIIRKTMNCQIVTLILIVISALCGFIPNNQSISSAGGFIRYRECLGYTYTTFAPNFLLSITLEWFYISRYKSRKRMLVQGILIMLVNIFFYQRTGTRTSLILITMVVLMKMIRSYKKSYKIKYKFITKNIFVIMAIISVGISFFYRSSIKWMAMLNSILSQRLRFAQEGLITWGITSFGTSIIWNSDAVNYNYIDSSYVNILVCYGIIVFLIVIIGLTITMHYACKINNKELIFSFVVWAIRAFVDPQLYLLWFNPFMFYIGAAVLMQLKINKKKAENAEEENAVNYMRI